MEEKDVVLVIVAEKLESMEKALNSVLDAVSSSNGVLVNEHSHPLDTKVTIQTLKYLVETKRKAHAKSKGLPYMYTIAIGHNSGGVQIEATYKHEIDTFVEFFKESFDDVHMWDVDSIVPNKYTDEDGVFTLYRSTDSKVVKDITVSTMLHDVLVTEYTEPDVLYLGTSLETLAEYPVGHSGLDLLDRVHVSNNVKGFMRKLKHPSNLKGEERVVESYTNQLAELDEQLEETVEYEDSDQESVKVTHLAFWQGVSHLYTLSKFVGLLIADIDNSDGNSDYNLLSQITFRLSEAPIAMSDQTTMDYEEFVVLLLAYMNFVPYGVDIGFEGGDAEDVIGFAIQKDGTVTILTENLVSVSYHRAYSKYHELPIIVPSQENYLKSISNLGHTLSLLLEG